MASTDVSPLCLQALLKEAHEVEVKKQKAEDKIERQLAVNKEETATEVYFTFPTSVMCNLFCPDRFLIFFFFF